MAEIPYVQAYGRLGKALELIKQAQTPPRFTQDFLETKLGLKGGSARPIIPFLKRTGFLASDGTPTDLYKQFRGTSAKAGAAAAEALKIGYAPLYEVNEYAHDASDTDLERIIVQVTGDQAESTVVKSALASFKVLKGFADFSDQPDEEDPPAKDEVATTPSERTPSGAVGSLKLGYTINLNLPATSEIAVFDAIFKSLREHLLS